jgi:hypothetical protein
MKVRITPLQEGRKRTDFIAKELVSLDGAVVDARLG